MAFDGAGNTLGTARELNITSTTQTFADWVGSTDTNDFYRFTLGSGSSFNLTLDGLSADADVQLIRDINNNGVVDSGEVINSSTRGSNNAESIISTLEAGTFYLRVYPYGDANTNYNLNVSATPKVIPLDFAGNNLGNARQITLNSTTSTYTDWVGGADTNDFYRFTLDVTSSFNLTLDGLSADADVQLIRDINNNGVVDSGEVIASSTRGSNNAESIISTLEAGTFYLRVYPYGNADTNYNLNVSATPVDYALNTLAQARQITLNSTASTYTDWVGSTDTNDFYRFNLNGASSFNLTLNGLSADADVELIRDINNNGVVDSGEVIARSTAGGANPESIISTLEAGTFYLRVYPYGNANTSYNLNVSATPSTIPLDFAGNNLGNARQITLNSTTSTYTDWVGGADTNDFYRFNLGLSSSFNLTLNGLSADADVELIRDINNNGIVDSGEVIASSTAGGTFAESIISTLEAGIFYLRVYPYGNANTSYNLNVSAIPRAIPLDFAGNNLGNARQITLNPTTNTYTDWVGSADTDDYYRFTLNTNSSLNLAVNGLTENADLQLIRDTNNNGVVDSGEVIISSTASGTNVESIISTLDAGTYYVRVYPNGNANTNYNLNVSATPVDYAGNTLSSARQITLNPTTSTYTDWVGIADTDDYYRFTLNSTSNLNLTLNGLSGNVHVQLLDSSGNVITSSIAGGRSNEYISRILSANIYYIRVYPGESGASTFYNLSIESNQAWIQQLGTANDDFSNSIAVDNAGNVYITGYTNGSLGGTNTGGQDAWVAKYSNSGTLLWKTQLGTVYNDLFYDVAVDGSGNVYVAGQGGDPSGNVIGVGSLLVKYDSNGTRIWTKLLDTEYYVFSSSLAIDNAGNIYATGGTEGTNSTEDIDAWVAKYDSDGNRIWETLLGTSSFDISNSVTVDGAGNVYLTGGSQGALGGSNAGDFDAWVAKLNSNGTGMWIKQLGTNARDNSFGIAVNITGDVYITGGTEGNLEGTNTGEVDAWLAKYDTFGNLKWKKQLGTSGFDVSNNITVASSGNVYITGLTNGVLATTKAGEDDAWFANYDSNGNQVFIEQLGTSSNDISRDIAVNTNGDVYITGTTRGNFVGTSAGKIDAWLARYYFSI